MHNVRTIFTLILVSLQRGRSDQLKTTECCNESIHLNISLPNCADSRCSYLSGNTAGNDGTYSPLDNKGPSSQPEEQSSEYTTDYDDDNRKCDFLSFDELFYRYDDQFIEIYNSLRPCFHFSPSYYDCKAVTGSKTTGNLYIKCPCGNTTECCPPGNLIFDQKEKIGSSWECSLKREKLDYWGYLNKTTKGQHFHILLYNTFDQNIDISNGSTEGQYIIVRSLRPYSIDIIVLYFNDSNNKILNLLFERKFHCSVEEINGYYPRKDLVCTKYPFIFLFQIPHRVLRYWCIIFGSTTLLVFMLLPPLWTMKTNIILCQTFSYLITDLVVLRHNLHSSLGEELPTYVDCILVVYNWHYWDLTSAFWGHIMSIDLALTFRGRGLNRGKSRRTSILYALYGWVGPLVVTLVTMILGFWVRVPSGLLEPDVNLEHCWFHTRNEMLMYHYVPEIILSAINTPLLGYAVYNIIKRDCTSDILRNKDSGCHIGNTVRKESRTRLILYFNLSLLIGSPKWFEYVKLVFIETDPLIWHIIGLVRTICIFLFLCCRKKVFLLLKEKLRFGRLSVPCVFTIFRSKSYKVNNPQVSNSVPQESTPL